jgi:Raf kinase inhibitor-like YbhB/YbcL family protein
MQFKRTMTGIACLAAIAAVSLAAQAPQGAPGAGAPGQGGPGAGGRAGGGGRGPAGPPLTLSSPAFTDLQLLPAKYGCAATPVNVSPPLAWTNAPAAAQSFAVVVLDADLRANRGHLAPSHWYIWNIPATVTSLPENVAAVAELPDGSRQTISAGRGGGPSMGYRSPCPPAPSPHHYSFELYALDTKLDALMPGASLTDLYAAMDTHVIGHQIMVVPFHQ